MTATDASAAVLGPLISLLLFAGFYIWTALALAAVFRKSGVEPWKAWVPVLNLVVLLQLAGLTPWLVLLALVPFGILVVLGLATYRLSLAFGYGAGLTVLGVVLLPAWASVIGFGSARWVGREESEPGPRRSASPAPSLPGFTSTGTAQPPSYGVTSAFAPLIPAEPAAPAPPLPEPPLPEPPLYEIPAHEAPRRPPLPSPPVEPATALGWAAPAGGWTPPPLPDPEADGTRRTDAEPQGADETVPADDVWRGFDVSDFTGEVTGAIPGAPAPVSAVAPPQPPEPVSEPVQTDEPDPWVPSRSPVNDRDAFPEASAPVSAVAGAPSAGGPMAARSSVSAFHTRPEIPDDAIEETVIARRRRTHWSLVPPTGNPVEIGSETVLLGRKPAADPQYPGAQLIAIQDGTVSKTHARLQLRDDRWYVTDLDSTNGVLFATLMGTEVEAPRGVEVEAGDRFLLGDAEIRLQRSDT